MSSSTANSHACAFHLGCQGAACSLGRGQARWRCYQPPGTALAIKRISVTGPAYHHWRCLVPHETAQLQICAGELVKNEALKLSHCGQVEAVGKAESRPPRAVAKKLGNAQNYSDEEELAADESVTAAPAPTPGCASHPYLATGRILQTLQKSEYMIFPRCFMLKESTITTQPDTVGHVPAQVLAGSRRAASAHIC